MLRRKLANELVKIGQRRIAYKYREVEDAHIREMQIGVNELGCVVAGLFLDLREYKQEVRLDDFL